MCYVRIKFLLIFVALFSFFNSAAFAGEKIRMATVAPGSYAYLVMTTLATIVNSNQDNYDIFVDATGAATKHMIEAADETIDIVMTSPSVMDYMDEGKVMYSRLETAPKLRQNLGLIFWFPYGVYHIITYANSGIKSLSDIKGKKIFLGIPGGNAYSTAYQWIEAMTGFKAGRDYSSIKASWSEAYQGFLNRQFDIYVTSEIPPFGTVKNFSSVGQLRVLGLPRSQPQSLNANVNRMLRNFGRSLDVIPAGIYDDAVVNKSNVYSIKTLAGVIAPLTLSEDTVYEITKTFWDNLEQVRKDFPFMDDVMIEDIFEVDNVKLHPGALRYYKEIGLEIPIGIR